MKSVLEGVKEGKAKTKYPFLGIAKGGMVILFTAKRTGTVIHNPHGHWPVGEHSEDWEEPNFEPLRGKVTLSN